MGHLMCAGCFTHLLADSRLRDQVATCPNCRCEISKSNASRNLAVEKAVSELPSECQVILFIIFISLQLFFDVSCGLQNISSLRDVLTGSFQSALVQKINHWRLLLHIWRKKNKNCSCGNWEKTHQLNFDKFHLIK